MFKNTIQKYYGKTQNFSGGEFGQSFFLIQNDIAKYCLKPDILTYFYFWHIFYMDPRPLVDISNLNKGWVSIKG